MCLGVGALGSLLLRMTEMCCWRGRLCPAAPVVLVAVALRLETRAAAAPPAPVALASAGSVAVVGRLLVGMCR